MKPTSVRVGIHQAAPGSGIAVEERARYRERRAWTVEVPLEGEPRP